MGRNKHKVKHKGSEATQVKVNPALAPSELPSDDADRTTSTSESEEQLTSPLDIDPTPSAAHDGPSPAEELAAESSQQLSNRVDAISKVQAPVKDDATDIVSSTAVAADSDEQELDAAPSSPPLPDEVCDEPSTTVSDEGVGLSDVVAAPDGTEAAAALPDEHDKPSSSLPPVASANEAFAGLDSDIQEVNAAPSIPLLPDEVHSELSTTVLGEGVGLQDAVAQIAETAAALLDEVQDEPSTTAAGEGVGWQDAVAYAAETAAALPDEVHDKPSTAAIEVDVGLKEAVATAYDGETAAALSDEVCDEPSTIATGYGVGLQEAESTAHDGDRAALPDKGPEEPSTTATEEGVGLQEAIATAHHVETAAALPVEVHDEPSTPATGGDVGLQDAVATAHIVETAAALPDEHDKGVDSAPSVANGVEPTTSQSAPVPSAEGVADLASSTSTTATGEGVGLQDRVDATYAEPAAAHLDERGKDFESAPPMADDVEPNASQVAPMPSPKSVGDIASTTATGEGAGLQDTVPTAHAVETAAALPNERDKESTSPPPVASNADSQSAPLPSPVSSLKPEGAGDFPSAKHDDGSTSLPPASAQADIHRYSLLPDSMELALPAAPVVESNNVKRVDGLTSASPAVVLADVHNSLPDSMEPALPPAPSHHSAVAIAAQLPVDASEQTLPAAVVSSRESTSGGGHTQSLPRAVMDDADRRSQAAEVASLRQAKQELETRLIKLQKGLRNRMKELANEKQDMQLQLDSASQRTAELEAQLKEQRALAEHQAIAHSEGATRLQMQVGRLAEELASANAELELRERALTESRRMASAKEQSGLDLQHILEQLTLQHKDTQAQLEEKVAQLTVQLAQTQANLQRNRDELVQERAHVDSRSAELETRLAAAAAEVEIASAKAAEEAATLEAALEVAKADLNRRTREQDAERERVKVAMVEMRKKVERAEAARRKAVASADGVKEVLENELQQSNTARNILDEELAAAKDQLGRLQEELRSYKQRAQMLLKRKEEELLASANAERNQAAEQALRETQQALHEVLAERDASVRAISEMAQQHQNELATYEEAAIAREQRIADLQQQFDMASMEVVRVADEWRARCETTERTWRERCEAMQAQIASLERSSKVAARTRSELESLRKERDRLKEEFNSFRDIASSMVEAKDTEIAKLLDDMAGLRVRHVRQQSDAASHLSDDTQTPLSRASMSWSSMTEKVNGRTERFYDPVNEDLAYQLHLQDKRDEQLAFAERKVMELQEELAESQQEIELHTAQETALKEAIRELERSKRREGVDMTYLKNIVLKLILSGEVETLLPVVGSLLQFAPEEIKRCKDVYDTRQAVPLSAAASVVDAMAQPTHSLFTSLAATFGSRT